MTCGEAIEGQLPIAHPKIELVLEKPHQVSMIFCEHYPNVEQSHHCNLWRESHKVSALYFFQIF